MQTKSVPIPDPITTPTVSVEVAGSFYGLGRTAAYKAVRTGEIPSIKIGRSIRVPVAELRRMLGIDQGSAA